MSRHAGGTHRDTQNEACLARAATRKTRDDRCVRAAAQISRRKHLPSQASCKTVLMITVIVSWYDVYKFIHRHSIIIFSCLSRDLTERDRSLPFNVAFLFS